MNDQKNLQFQDGIPPGMEVDLSKIKGPPERVPLPGAFVTVAPVDPERDADSLYRASHSSGLDDTGRIWRYMGYGPFESRQDFCVWLDGAAASADPLFFTLLDHGSRRAAGMASLMRIDARNGAIEVGNIWMTPLLQQTRAATEAMYLMAHYIFETLGYRRYEWKCNAYNLPSRRAAVRYGFQYEGTFRQHLVVKGRNRDTAWFSMMDYEWPAVKRRFEAWLAPENFDAYGRQIRSLSSFA